MAYTGEPSNFAGGDKFLEQITAEDLQVLREEVPKLIQKLKTSLQPNDIKVYNHSVASKVISITVDGGNEPVFPEIPAIGMGLLRVSSSSDNLKKLPNDFYHVVRYRNLSPLFEEDDAELAEKRIAEMESLWNDPRVQKFSKMTGIEFDDLGTSFQKSPDSFMGIVRDVVEWAYICYIADKYCPQFDIVVVKDGRLEQHGVTHHFIDKLRTFFQKHDAKVVGVIKSSKLLNGSNGISLLVIAEWIRMLDKEFYFKVPDKLMSYVHLHRRVWDPEYVGEDGQGGFAFGHRYIGKMFAKTFKPLESMFSLDVPFYFDGRQDAINDIVAAIIANRSLLFGGSFAPTLEAHAKASISDHIRLIVQDHLVKETNFKYPF